MRVCPHPVGLGQTTSAIQTPLHHINISFPSLHCRNQVLFMALLQWLSAVSLLASTVVVVLVLAATHLPKKRRTNLPPGPPPLPVVGNLHQLGRMPHLSLQRLARKYGPIIHLTLGHIPTVVVSSARIAKEVLRTHDLSLSSRPQLYAAKQLFYGCTDVAFAPYGPYWRHARKICILELLSTKRVESYGPARAAEVDQLVRRITAASSSPGGAVRLSRLLGLYANGVLCRAAFGRDFAEGGEYDRHGFHKMLDEYQALLGGFSLGDFYPSLEWVSAVTGMKRRLERTFKRFDCLFDEIVEEHGKRRKRREEEEEEEVKDLVDVLLDIQKDGSLEMPLTMDNIKAIILVSDSLLLHLVKSEYLSIYLFIYE